GRCDVIALYQLSDDGLNLRDVGVGLGGFIQKLLQSVRRFLKLGDVGVGKTKLVKHINIILVGFEDLLIGRDGFFDFTGFEQYFGAFQRVLLLLIRVVGQLGDYLVVFNRRVSLSEVTVFAPENGFGFLPSRIISSPCVLILC